MKQVKVVIERPADASAQEYRELTGKVLSAIVPALKPLIKVGSVKTIVRRAANVAIVAMVVAMAIAPALADDFFDRQDQTRSYYDHNGSFAGTTNQHGNDNTTSAYDRNGHFSGSAIRNSDGTTSFYDHSGHFTGSSINTSPPRGRGR